MKGINQKKLFIFHRVPLRAVIIFLILSLNSRNNISAQYVSPSTYDSTQKWVDWNVVFQPTSTVSQRTLVMDFLKKYVELYVANWNSVNHTSIPVQVSYDHCPCDPLLYNLSTNPLAGSGLAASPPPKPGNGTPAAGDQVKFFNINRLFYKDAPKGMNVYEKYGQSSQKLKPNSEILAIMDTGLDSTLFVNNFKDLLWVDPTGKPTLRNFQFINNHKPLNYYFDDASQKHGSAVTSLALESFQKYDSGLTNPPKVMVLKVLDKDEMGTTFTVSCALSYAVQKKATLINASLGYYYYGKGEIDSVLRNYVELCKTGGSEPIPLLAAAGNLQIPHIRPFCQKINPANNALNENRLFYPGCFSKNFDNVICVTGLQNTMTPCTYQNFSDEYISMGVLTNPGDTSFCCSFPVRFFKQQRTLYEGSSFSTPVVSGHIMAIKSNNPGISLADILKRINENSSGTGVKYTTYISSRF